MFRYRLTVAYTSDFISFPQAPLKLRPYNALWISLLLLSFLFFLTLCGYVPEGV